MNQIQIMWLFWLKLYLHHKILAFKGQEGQERPSNFFQPNLAEQNFIAKSFILENMHFLFSEHSHIVACKGVYFTSAWPCWPLKAKIFSSKHFFLYNWWMFKVWIFSLHWFFVFRGGPKLGIYQCESVPWLKSYGQKVLI